MPFPDFPTHPITVVRGTYPICMYTSYYYIIVCVLFCSNICYYIEIVYYYYIYIHTIVEVRSERALVITDIFVGQYNTDISVTLPIQQHDHTYVYNATYIILLLWSCVFFSRPRSFTLRTLHIYLCLCVCRVCIYNTYYHRNIRAIVYCGIRTAHGIWSSKIKLANSPDRLFWVRD